MLSIIRLRSQAQVKIVSDRPVKTVLSHSLILIASEVETIKKPLTNHGGYPSVRASASVSAAFGIAIRRRRAVAIADVFVVSYFIESKPTSPLSLPLPPADFDIPPPDQAKLGCSI